jgi:IS4 transposase
VQFCSTGRAKRGNGLFIKGATTIGRIYGDRWEIEIFFKVLKQHLKIKTFVGTSPNASTFAIQLHPDCQQTSQ